MPHADLGLIVNVLEHAKSFGPEVLGGFVGYFMHQMQHTMFKRPGRALMRLLGRRHDSS